MTRRPGDAVSTEDIAGEILAAPKYRHLDRALVNRLAGEALRRCRDRKEAVKYAKRKLHQAYGAFLSGAPGQVVNSCVDAVRDGRAELRDACRAAMRVHASTAERLDRLAEMYGQIAQWCGGATSVVDLACGLNPLAIPWMELAPDASYWCCEIDRDLVGALGRLDEILPVHVTSATCDLAAAAPALRADLALLLKTVNTLEQQNPGAANRLLTALDCRHVVVSVARRSLSGRREYTDDAEALLARAVAGSGYRAQDQAVFGEEMLWHLVPRRDDAAAGDPATGPTGDAAAPGALTVAGTPIGNLGDLPAGSLAALTGADVVCAEDTRRTRKLLSAYDVHPPRLVSIRAHNEQAGAERVLGWLAEGRRVVYVTDAGMPTLSDPGQVLVSRVLAAGAAVSVTPGPDAATTALRLSGFAVQRWCFEGFLPVKGAARAARLDAIATEPRTVVLFEAPHRLVRTLDDLTGAVGGDRPVAVVNDATKRFEWTWRGSLAQVGERLRHHPVRGEFVLVLDAPAADRPARRTPGGR